MTGYNNPRHVTGDWLHMTGDTGQETSDTELAPRLVQSLSCNVSVCVSVCLFGYPPPTPRHSETVWNEDFRSKSVLLKLLN